MNETVTNKERLARLADAIGGMQGKVLKLSINALSDEQAAAIVQELLSIHEDLQKGKSTETILKEKGIDAKRFAKFSR